MLPAWRRAVPGSKAGRLPRLLGLALLAAPLLAAARPAAAAPAACPTTPTRVVRSTGGVTDYHGSVPGIPELCHMDRPDGSGDFYWGVWRTDWPGAGDAYPALRRVILGPKGTRATFDTHSVPGLQWHDTLVNEGTEPLGVAGKTYTVLRIAHEREGFDGNTYHSIITSWRDVATGATLQTVEKQISGQSYGPGATWTAAKVEVLE